MFSSPLFCMEKIKCKLACDDIRAKGEKRKLCKLKRLQAERYAYDRDAANNSGKKVSNCHFPSQKNEPDEINDGMFFKLDADIFAEWCQHELCEFEALDAKGDADDGDTEQEPKDRPRKSKPNAAKKKPYQIADEFHGKSS